MFSVFGECPCVSVTYIHRYADMTVKMIDSSLGEEGKEDTGDAYIVSTSIGVIV